MYVSILWNNKMPVVGLVKRPESLGICYWPRCMEEIQGNRVKSSSNAGPCRIIQLSGFGQNTFTECDTKLVHTA